MPLQENKRRPPRKILALLHVDYVTRYTHSHRSCLSGARVLQWAETQTAYCGSAVKRSQCRQYPPALVQNCSLLGTSLMPSSAADSLHSPQIHGNTGHAHNRDVKVIQWTSTYEYFLYWGNSVKLWVHSNLTTAFQFPRTHSNTTVCPKLEINHVKKNSASGNEDFFFLKPIV